MARHCACTTDGNANVTQTAGLLTTRPPKVLAPTAQKHAVVEIRGLLYGLFRFVITLDAPELASRCQGAEFSVLGLQFEGGPYDCNV